MSLCVICPTIGRWTLKNTLESIWLDSEDGDLEVMVVNDGLNSPARRIFDEYAGEGWSYEEVPWQGFWGHAASNWALDKIHQLGRSSHVARMDDDDTYTVGAIQTLLACQADVPVIFRARWGDGHPSAGVELPHMHEVRYGNIASPMVLAPVCNARYGLLHEGDFSYCVDLVEELGEPIWREELICVVRPETL